MDAQHLALRDDTIQLIVTSPPYASNAIDYMRAHKFSLVWFGYAIGDLGAKRRDYIGAEAIRGITFEALPHRVEEVILEVERRDAKKAQVLRRYYSEMTRTLCEMYRVLCTGRAAIMVVGTSLMRGVDTRVQHCVGAIASRIGFDLVGVGVRNLDRDRRMMPARWQKDSSSQIEQRMHKEYVIAFLKPDRKKE